ncbi:MAG: SUF system Fe-S cluster assembly regulator [Candidatus Binatia bacterium]|nr:MAG: SUF system Fe-S cluster assembly regulator [Candidatus Binatia bacterium]
MIRIARMTDYGIVIMRHLASEPRQPKNASAVARAARLPRATVSKLLRMLAREGLLVSFRGAGGGYELARSPNEISVAEIIQALEGPIALTNCSSRPSDCAHEPVCPVRGHWQQINAAIRTALETVTLANLVNPAHALPLGSGAGRGAEPRVESGA